MNTRAISSAHALGLVGLVLLGVASCQSAGIPGPGPSGQPNPARWRAPIDRWRAPIELPPRARGAETELVGGEPSPSTARSSSLHTAWSTRLPGLTVEPGQDLSDVCERLSVITGLSFMVLPAAEQALLDAGVDLELSLSGPIRLRSILDLLVDRSGDSIAWTLRHGVVVMTTQEKARADSLALRFYDVRDLLAGVASFPAPAVGSLLADGDEAEREIVRRPAVDEDVLIERITSTVAPGTWDDEGVSIEIMGGLLVVRQTVGVHRRLEFL